jgi:hypothetical protein
MMRKIAAAVAAPDVGSYGTCRVSVWVRRSGDAATAGSVLPPNAGSRCASRATASSAATTRAASAAPAPPQQSCCARDRGALRAVQAAVRVNVRCVTPLGEEVASTW